jgi:hypothetical protein
MRRREFIAGLGAAAVWPVTARGQQQGRMRHVGALMSQAAADPVAQVRYAAFLQGLQQSGWEVGRNLRLDTRWTPGSDSAQRMRESAAELAALAPEVILATGSAATAPSCKRRAPYRLFSSTHPTRWARALLAACRGRAATPPALSILSTLLGQNGWKCSKK